MRKLMTLELRRTHMKPYWLTILLSTPLVFFLVYFIASLPPEDGMESSFTSTGQMSSVIVGILTTIISILAAVMLVRFVFDDYKGKGVILLFSYPVSRTKVFLSKLLIIVGFGLGTNILASLLISSLLSLLNPILHITPLDYGFNQLGPVFLGALMCGIIGLSSPFLGLLIGFLIKSGPAIIITPVIISSLLTNTLTHAATQDFGFLAIIASAACLVSGAVLIYLNQQIKHMEVE